MQEKVRDEVPNIKRDGWSADKVSEEASNKEPDEIYRQIARGDETKGDADERDIAGSPDACDTPHGREEAKNCQNDNNQ